MMSDNLEIDQELGEVLAVLQPQPGRDPNVASQARSAFLAQAQLISQSAPAAVSGRGVVRHNNWMQRLLNLIWTRNQEQRPMLTIFGTILMILSLMVGGSGVTVAAAQQSLPDQVLYPVKTWSEDLRTQLTQKDQARLQLALEFSNRRMEEVQAMVQSGEVVPQAVQVRLQQEMDVALQLAARQTDDQMVQALIQIRNQLRSHEQVFNQLGVQAGVENGAFLTQVRAMTQERLKMCEQGIEDPVGLRNQLRDTYRRQQGESTRVPESTPQNGGSGNPWTTGSPTPGSGYGPGPGGNGGWVTGTPTPGSGYGPGPGSSDGSGNYGRVTGTPTPGSGYGPGPGNGDPSNIGDGEGQENGPGGSENSGGSEPGGNGNGGNDETGGDGGGGNSGESGGNDGGNSGGSGGNDAGGGSNGGSGSGGGH